MLRTGRYRGRKPGGFTRPSGGFTLLELLVVMAIAGAIAAVALLRIENASPGEDLARAGCRMIREVRWLRHTAITKQAHGALRIDLAAGTVTSILSDVAGNPAPTITLAERNLPGDVRIAAIRKKSGDTWAAAEPEIYFFPNGTVEDTLIRMESDGLGLTLHIHALTGEVTVTGGEDG